MAGVLLDSSARKNFAVFILCISSLVFLTARGLCWCRTPAVTTQFKPQPGLSSYLITIGRLKADYRYSLVINSTVGGVVREVIRTTFDQRTWLSLVFLWKPAWKKRFFLNNLTFCCSRVGFSSSCNGYPTEWCAIQSTVESSPVCRNVKLNVLSH